MNSVFANSQIQNTSNGLIRGDFDQIVRQTEVFGHHIRTEKQRLGLACSRLGRQPKRMMQVAELLGDLIDRSSHQHVSFLVGKGTAIAPWVSVAEKIWQAPVEWFEPTQVLPEWIPTLQENDKLGNALPRADAKNPEDTRNRFKRTFVVQKKHPMVDSIDIDHAIIWLSDVIYVPWMRKGGKIESLINDRLARDPQFRVRFGETIPQTSNAFRWREWTRSAPRTAAAQPRRRQPPKTLSPLKGHRTSSKNEKKQIGFKKPQRKSAWQIPKIFLTHEWIYHCTRAPRTHWPEETEEDFKKLILRNPRAALSRSALDTLCRIAEQERLIAQASASSHRYPVVCFSARPLQDLLNARCYRPHLQRWDYEPYGVAINKLYAQTIGIRPVIYTDQSTATHYPKQNRYRLHPRGTTYDWTKEQEWRCSESMDLRQIPEQKICLFAEDSSNSRNELRFSRWPTYFLARQD